MLCAFMLITGINQARWITFAPVTSEAIKFYSTTDLAIGLLSLCSVAYPMPDLPPLRVADRYVGGNPARPHLAQAPFSPQCSPLTRGIFPPASPW